MGLEFELKYTADDAQRRAVLAEFGGFSPIAMETTYYDTRDDFFSARKMTLRRRMENGSAVCTLKMPGSGHGRQEFETESATIAEAIPVLCKLSQWDDLSDYAKALVPVCGAKFTRMAATVVLPECTLEIAVDSGVLTGGGKELPLGEIEVELKSGSEDAAVAFAEALAQRHGLQPEPKSKFRRALELGKENGNGI